MATIHDFEQARRDKFVQKPYEAPALIESVPNDTQEALQVDAAERRRRSLKIAVSLIQSIDIPPSRELTENERPPVFENPSSGEK